VPSVLLALVVASCCERSPAPARGVTTVVVAPPGAATPTAVPTATTTPTTTTPEPRSAHVEPNGCRFGGPVRVIALAYEAQAPETRLGGAEQVDHAVVVLGDKAGASSCAAFDIFGLQPTRSNVGGPSSVTASSSSSTNRRSCRAAP
jgi:hypothetical protein